MNRNSYLLSFVLLACASQFAFAQENGFKPIFDGHSLSSWNGDSKYWRVENGVIVGESTKEVPLKTNTFLVWDHEVDDFELRLKFRISGSDRANSGIQIRSQVEPSGHMVGYQADIDRSGQHVGIVYDEKTGRGILCRRGSSVTIASDGTRLEDIVADPKKVLEHIKLDDWNDYSIVASGHRLELKINGHITATVTDKQNDLFDRKGRLGLQIHAGPPMKIEFKDVRLKRLPLANSQKKVVFVAGKKSHGWGQHEHNAGCLLLAKRLQAASKEAGLPVLTTVYQSGWPTDPTALDNADTVVSYCDGGKNHYLHHNSEAFDSIMRRGTGLVCIHYGVEVPKGPTGQRFLNWIGGYFEPHWSVNPHWTAKFETIPEHPVTRGVKPFEIKDEWYYHMRFAPEMTRVSPLLSALPPKDSLSRPDGPHSGNPHVRKAVLENKQVQHLAWAFERGDGKGRGFGFTGGHFHHNWKHDDFRKLVLNAIVWTAHGEVPQGGVESATPTQEELDANQDYPKPDNE